MAAAAVAEAPTTVAAEEAREERVCERRCIILIVIQYIGITPESIELLSGALYTCIDSS